MATYPPTENPSIFKDLPAEVAEWMATEQHDEFVVKIERPDSEDFVVGGLIILPYHGWDLNEVNIQLETFNLEEIHDASIMGGMGFAVYQKVDSEKPAYAAGVYYEEYSMVLLKF